MAFDLADAAEAYAAISLLVVGADEVGTMEERHFLFDDLGEVDVFADHDKESLGALLGTLVGRMFQDVSDDGVTLNADAVSEVCAGVNGVLDEGQRFELFSLAVRLAYSDGLDRRERDVLVEIASHLGMDGGSASAMIDEGAD